MLSKLSAWSGIVPTLIYGSIALTAIEKTGPIYECRYDERLKTKAEGSTRLAYTGLLGALEHLKIETRLIDERFPSVMCESRLFSRF